MKIALKNLFKKKPSVLMGLFESPDDYIYTMEVEKGEIVIRAKKKEIKTDGRE